MKRLILTALLSIVCIALASCGGNKEQTSSVKESVEVAPASVAEVETPGSTAVETEVKIEENVTENNNMQDSQIEVNATDGVVENKEVKVKIFTDLGDLVIKLYDETPKHRDNFLKLAKEGYYNGTLFHRVINEFMVQAGDPDSKNAPQGKMLGMGDPGYTIEAEIVYPQYFHKRGVLAAARQGDQTNPERRSSGSQFYIVTGTKYNPGQLSQLENQLLRARQQEVFNRLATERRDTIMSLRRNRDQAGLQALNDELMALMEAEIRSNPPRLTEAQRQAYSTIGGTPHLDGQYTVFGEVLEGMEVVDSLQRVSTDRNDRPVEDVKILKMELL